jgi:hypothetical protein
MVFFKILGAIFSWLAPFAVVYVNHVVLEDSSFNVDMFGLLIILGLAIGLVRYINGRVEKWDIRNEHRIFRINWNNGKKILMAVALTWVLYTIEDSMDKIQWSGVLISASFILGWVFTLLGNLKKDKKKSLDF